MYLLHLPDRSKDAISDVGWGNAAFGEALRWMPVTQPLVARWKSDSVRGNAPEGRVLLQKRATIRSPVTGLWGQPSNKAATK
jgi:hypothetical protein